MAKKSIPIHESLKILSRPYDHNHRITMQSLEVTVQGKIIAVPSDFIYDGASVPRAVWSIVGSPFQPEFEGPEIVHRYLYRTHAIIGGTRITRKEADLIFRELLAWNNVGPVHRQIMYRGVRLGGWASWKR